MQAAVEAVVTGCTWASLSIVEDGKRSFGISIHLDKVGNIKKCRPTERGWNFIESAFLVFPTLNSWSLILVSSLPSIAVAFFMKDIVHWIFMILIFIFCRNILEQLVLCWCRGCWCISNCQVKDKQWVSPFVCPETHRSVNVQFLTQPFASHLRIDSISS